VEETISRYGILPDDIYNFDEIGFAIGLVSTVKVVTRANYYGRRSVIQLGNRVWVTTVETINTLGWCLPPMIIFKGKRYIELWFCLNLPND
jgi:DDE superfamily endonuclease.